MFHNIANSTKLLSCKSSAYPCRCVMVWQVCFTPNGVDMRMVQPCSAPLRRHFLPAVKAEYSVSTRQSSYRVQIHRIQVKDVYDLCRDGISHLPLPTMRARFVASQGFECWSSYLTDPEPASWSHLPLCVLPSKTT